METFEIESAEASADFSLKNNRMVDSQDDDGTTIGERVLKEFHQPEPNWTPYTLDEIHRAYSSLIGWRKMQRSRTKRNQEEWNQNGDRLRLIQAVLAKKWAERGKAALLEKIVAMEVNCSNLNRINNYDDLFLAELRLAYKELRSAAEDKKR